MAPKSIAIIGAVLIAVSGIVNIVLGAHTGALTYEIFPGGKMGHVGVLAGAAAVGLAAIIGFFVIPLYEHEKRRIVRIGGVLTILLGHLGAIAGALYVGTAGVIACYIAGIWVLVAPGGETSEAGAPRQSR
jgi:hypothetical protein